MSAAALRRIGLGNGWQPEVWQLRLADQLAKRMNETRAAMAVFGIFGTALLRDGIDGLGEFAGEKYIVLQNGHKRDLAKDYLSDLARVLGVTVHMGKPLFKANTAASEIAGDPEFSRECQRRIDRLKAKSFNKGVQM